MGRPPIPRVVRCFPGAVYYKPRGIPLRLLEEVVLGLDEMEALRLADVEGLPQEEIGRRMKVSRATAGRILETAHRKVADALVGGKALRIEGGAVEVVTMRKFLCYDCKKEWEVPYGTGRPQVCPQCGSVNIHRHPEDRGGLGGGGGRGRGRCLRGGRIPTGHESVKPAQT